MKSINNPAIERCLLEKVYESSQAMMRQIIDSAHSHTLEELYTDEFRPHTIKANKTLVKSLSTGEPVPAEVSYTIKNRNITDDNRRKYFLRKEDDKKILGTKSFGIVNRNDKKLFTPGYIESTDNNHYAGTQIRLLQVACEIAKRNGINEMPLTALFPAMKFHTMMGFRPTVEQSSKVQNLKDLTTSLDMFEQMYKKSISFEDIRPVLSKVDGELYFDRNRTAYCAVMKMNERELERTHKRNLKLSLLDEDNDVSMVLKGKEFNKWQERIKGFEILPEAEQEPDKLTLWQQFKGLFAFFD